VMQQRKQLQIVVSTVLHTNQRRKRHGHENGEVWHEVVAPVQLLQRSW
jgi:hypothetical protein